MSLTLLLLACAPAIDPAAPVGAPSATAPTLPLGFEGVPVRPVNRKDMAPEVVRFAVIGDGGNGNDPQYDVADAMKTVCDRDGCEFVLYTGDNIYTDGVDGTDDIQFVDKFEAPYAELDMPFYMALGNHDYGGGGSGYEFWKDDYQIQYTDHSEKWTMPGNYYDFTVGPAQFFALDTNAILWGFPEEQYAWLGDGLAASTSRWTVAFGHHPYLSNGPHGNAGQYDGRDDDPIDSGWIIKDFFDQAVCGQVNVYICGHDHSLQWMVGACGTEFLVSGAASSTTPPDEGDNPTYFYDRSYGFLWVEINGETFTGRYYDDDANLLFERSFEHP